MVKNSTNFLQTGILSTSFIVDQVEASRDAGVPSSRLSGIRNFLFSAEVHSDVRDMDSLQSYLDSKEFATIMARKNLCGKTISRYESDARMYMRLRKQPGSSVRVTRSYIAQHPEKFGVTSFNSQTNTVTHTRLVSNRETVALAAIAEMDED